MLNSHLMFFKIAPWSLTKNNQCFIIVITRFFVITICKAMVLFVFKPLLLFERDCLDFYKVVSEGQIFGKNKNVLVFVSHWCTIVIDQTWLSSENSWATKWINPLNKNLKTKNANFKPLPYKISVFMFLSSDFCLHLFISRLTL